MRSHKPTNLIAACNSNTVRVRRPPLTALSALFARGTPANKVPWPKTDLATRRPTWPRSLAALHRHHGTQRQLYPIDNIVRALGGRQLGGLTVYAVRATESWLPTPGPLGSPIITALPLSIGRYCP